MAKKLNKKVAIIGSVFMTVILMTGIVVGLKLVGVDSVKNKLGWGDPEEYITQARAALKQADDLIKEYEAKGDKSEEAIEAVAKVYKVAERKYGSAIGCAVDDKQRIEILFELVGHYQKDHAYHLPEWPKIRGCWSRIKKINPKNIEARVNEFNYSYELQENIRVIYPDGDISLWIQIEKMTGELIDIMKNKGMTVAPRVLKAKAWAILELADVNEDPEKYVDEAIAIFEGLIESKTDDGVVVYSDDLEVYDLLGRAYQTRGAMREKRGVYSALENAKVKQEELVQLSIEKVKDKAKAKVNWLNMRFFKTLVVVSPLKSRLDLPRRNMKKVEAFEKAIETAPEGKRLKDLKNELIKAKKAVADNKLQLQNQLIALSAEYSMPSGIQEDISSFLLITDPDVFRTTGMKIIKTIESQIFQPFKDEFIALSVEYPSSADVHQVFSSALRLSEPLNYDAAIDEMAKAIDLDKENVVYALGKSNLYYSKAMNVGDTKALEDGIETAKRALGFPDIRDIVGPKESMARGLRFNLYTYLAKCHIERAMIAQLEDDDAQSKLSIFDAENAVHKMFQIEKSNKFLKFKWDGLLAMVKGDKPAAVSNLYYAQENVKASNKVDTQVSYFLSKLLEGRTEIGSRVAFLRDAIQDKNDSIARIKPHALLDYAEILVQMRQYTSAQEVAMVFVENYGSNYRSDSINVICDIAGKRFEKVKKMLSQMDPKSGKTINLRLTLIKTRISYIMLQLSALDSSTDEDDLSTAESLKEEIKQFKAQRFSLVMRLIEMKSANMPFPTGMCGELVKNGNADKAKELTDAFITVFENNNDALFYKAILAEADPLDVPLEKQNEIREQIYANTVDELQRHILLGSFYSSQGENEKSLTEYEAALKIDPDNLAAAGGVFDVALKMEDIDKASSILPTIRKNNFDDCGGEFFAARIDIAQKSYESAIKRLDECLVKRPIFPYAYFLRSHVCASMGNHEEAVANAHAAARINSLDGAVAKHVAMTIHARNNAFGKRVEDSHRDEMEKALRVAIALNPGDWQLQSFYTEYISSTEPEKSIAIQQGLARRVPNVENHLLLGKMAMNLAVREINKVKKQFYFGIAGPAFEKAFEMAPDDVGVVDSYCDFLRVTGKHEQAIKLLEGRGNLLWHYYLRDGQSAKAKTILDELYQTNSQDIEVLRGLMLVCQQISDKDGLIKYSEELMSIDKQKLLAIDKSVDNELLQIAIDQSIDNELLQIQMYLDAGLVSESSSKLAGFRTEYPDEQRGLLLEAWSTMSNGKLDKALKLIINYIAIDPENPIAWRLRGQIHAVGGNYDKAIEAMVKSRDIDNSSTIQIELANAYNRSGNTTKAVGILSEALEDGRTPMRMLKMLESIYIQSGRKSELPAFYKATLEKYPESIDWHFRAGRFSLMEGKFSDAEKYFGRAWEFCKDTKGNFIVLDGYLAAIRGGKGFQRAINFASKYTDSEYAPIAYLNMANAEKELDNRKKSREHYLKAIEASGVNSSFVLKILGDMSKILGMDEVVKWCDGELSKDSKSFPANRMMAMVMVEKQEFDKSIVYIDNCLAGFAPGTDGYLELLAVKANIALGAYMKTAKDSYLDMAVKSYTVILIKRPLNSGVMNNLAYLLAETGRDIDKAVEYGKRAHKIVPNDANVMDTYAFTLCKAGDYKQAKELIQSAIGILGKDNTEMPWDVINHLGMANEGLLEIEEAKGNYKEALKLAGDDIPPKSKEKLIAALARVSK